MSNRISECFRRAHREDRGAFIAYLTVGYPTIEKTEQAIDELVAGGADIIELGVPFSDPFADGAVIRAAAYRALEAGVTLQDALALAKRVRTRHPQTGLVLFSYYNLIFSMGLEHFAATAAESGIDAVLAVDLPFEEREELLAVLRPRDLGFVPLVAPNTSIERAVASSKGIGDSFIYAITVKGITGARASLPDDLAGHLDALRKAVEVPVAAGFGISTRAQAQMISRHADGFIVGSALVRRLGETGSLAGELLP